MFTSGGLCNNIGMNKYLVSILFAFSVLFPSAAWAQFAKNSLRRVSNATRLQQAVFKASLRAKLPRWGVAVRVPKQALNPGQTLLTPARVVPLQTPANRLFLTQVETLFNKVQKAGLTRADVAALLAAAWVQENGKGFYHSQAALARDLHRFYGDEGPLYEMGGSRVRMYALPVDGILYQPEEYHTPLVLKADEYFVIYDVVNKTGQLVENTPGVYNAFKEVEE